MMTPPVLLPYQASWLSDTSPITFCEKSRRVGITYASAAEAVLIAAAKSGSNCYYSGLNREMAQDFVSDAADFARHFNLAASAIEEELFEEDEENSILSYKISFASGFKIIALSSRPSAIRGKQGVFYVDEAAFHDDLNAMMKACVALLMWGGRVRVISTHFGQDNPFNELIEEARAGKKPFKVHRVTLREAVDQGLYRRICEVNNTAWTPELEATWVKDLYDFYGDDAGEELDVIPSSESRSYIARDRKSVV